MVGSLVVVALIIVFAVIGAAFAAILVATLIVTVRRHQRTRSRRRRSRRGWAALLVLAMVPSAGVVCGLAGDGAFPVGCAHFVTTLRTSEPSYVPGQLVIITVTQINEGPACTIPPQPCGPAQASASAYNPAGKDVWDYGARKTFPGLITCPPPGATWPALYSDTQELDWSQDDCTLRFGLPGHANPGCPATQVPAGTYRITGEFNWSDGRTVGHGPPASATITITRPRSIGREDESGRASACARQRRGSGCRQ
jgi:hypothetical protein